MVDHVRDDAEEFEDYPVFCAAHGDRPARYVCRHLLEGVEQGCFTPDPEVDCKEAWCAECEAVLDEEGSWNERAADFAYFRLVCDICFREIKSKNLPRVLH